MLHEKFHYKTLEDIEKMSNIDYNIYDTCCNDGSEFQKKECRNNAD